MKNSMIGLFLFGCGSAGADFGLTTTVEFEGGVDARAVIGAGGSAGNAASSGGAVNTGGAIGPRIDGAPTIDPACGPTLECTWYEQKPNMNCTTEADCCRGFTCPGTGFCVKPQSNQCTTDEDCPCRWECVLYPGTEAGGDKVCVPGDPFR